MRIPTTTLIATGPFGPALPAARVAAALARGLQAGGLQPPDLLPIQDELEPGQLRGSLDALGLDLRLRRARAVVLGEWRIEEERLPGSVAFEIATRARQSGVPAFLVAGESRLTPFDARMLDLQAILTARDARALTRAGRKLAALI